MNHHTASEHRLGICWPGHIAATTGQPLVCEIVEVGLKDALVSLEPSELNHLSSNRLASLSFRSPANPESDVCETPVQIVSLDDRHARLVFEFPDQIGVRELNTWAFEQQSDNRNTTQFDPRRTQELFDKCVQTSRRFFEEQLPAVPDTAKETLFERAHNASSNTQQAESFDAMQEVERVMPSVIHGFLEEFSYCTGRLWTSEVPDTHGKGNDVPDELSLIDTGSFNDWLLTVQIIERAKRRGNQLQKDLTGRISQLLRGDLEETAFGLEGVCSTFHDALQNLGAGRATRQALLIAFEIEIVKRLDDLHRELNGLLDSAGVKTAPKKPVAVPVPVGAPAQPSAAAPESTDTASEQTSPLATPGDTTIHNLGNGFRTVQTLVQLRREPSAPAHATPAGEPALPHVVLEALADMDEKEGSPEATLGKPSLTNRVKAHLSSVEIEPDDATNDVLDLVSDLVESMLNDPLIHPEVTSAISRLSLSLSRSALAGDAFFAEASHPARQLLDALALVRAAQSMAGSWDRINAALVPVTHATVPTRREYAKALSVITPIAERRAVQLRQSINDAMEQFDAQQETLEAMTSEGNGQEEPTSAPLALKVWLGRVDHLSPGDVVVFENAAGSARPATLAWKGRDGMTLAFVEHDEYESISHTRQAVAMELRSGKLRKIEGGTLGLTERALCRQLYALHRQVHCKAANEPLTGLVNRKHFEEKIRSSLSSANESFDPDYLCLVQLDDFSAIHSRCGRRVSKQLLCKLANMLRRQVDEAGLVCRIKGHRFGILIQSGDREDVISLMQRYRRSVEESRCVFQGKPFPITVSAGLIPVDPSTGSDSPQDVIANVETALTRAISDGGNRVEVPELASRDQLVADNDEPSVTELIRDGRLGLRAQRVQPLTDGLLPYYEILLGVREPDGRLAPPGRVIAAAEQRDQIGQLDRWVLQESMTWMMGNPLRLEGVSGYAMNLSGITLSDEHLLEYVVSCIKRTGAPSDKLIFEVTETAGIDSLSVAQNFVRELRELGCRFSLDDFGVGHASFAYLRNLPVDKIKIDGMFVKDLTTNPNDYAVVRSINEIAKFMDRLTVAEFVENQETLAVLKRLGIDYAQGYGIEKPMPIDEIMVPVRLTA